MTTADKGTALRGEGYAVGTIFALNGALYGCWFARVPDAADRTHSSPGVLGVTLLSIALGAIVAMPFAGRLCARIDSRYVVITAAALNCLALPLIALANSPLTLAAALAVYGVAAGSTDVSMNTNAVAAIRRAGRPLMPLFHGAFSVGGMIGAAAGGLAAAHVGLGRHFTISAVVGLAVLGLAARRLPPDPPVSEAPAAGDPPSVPRARRFDGTIAVLGAVAFCSAVGEGAMGDWSALFMRDVLGVTAGLAAVGFATFSLTMATGRFAGTAVLLRFGPARTLICGCALATAGALAVVLAPGPVVALAGFAVVGAGLAYGFPIALNAAGAHPSGSGPAIGLVSTIGYAGFVAGPPAIGLVAQWADLRVGLGVVAVASVAGLLLAVTHRRLLQEADPSRTAATAGPTRPLESPDG